MSFNRASGVHERHPMLWTRKPSPMAARRRLHFLAPTLLEYWAMRCALPHAHLHWSGVGLVRRQEMPQGTCVVVCGLAGALVSDLPPGTILIPERVGLADGRTLLCDPALVQALATAAHSLRLRLDTRPLLTASSLVVGDERLEWAQRGFVAVDMETGLLAGQGLRVATIRVVLDGPEHDIASDWQRPWGSLLSPRLWPQLFWLGRAAPRYALRAARVVKRGLGTETGHLFVE